MLILLGAAFFVLGPGARAVELYASYPGFGGPNGGIGKYTAAGGVQTSGNGAFIIGREAPFGLAVSGADLFVTDNDNGTVAEFTTGGAPVNSNLITGLGGPTGITAVGSNLYISTQADGAVQLYNTSGTALNTTLITGLSGPRQIAVNGNHLFVTSLTAGANPTGIVGEYTTSGAVVNANLIIGLTSGITSVAVSDDGSTLFVGDQNTGTIGSYSATTGAAINATLISGRTPEYLLVSGNDLYEGDFGGTVAQYTMAGTPVNAALFTAPAGVLAIALPEPASCLLVFGVVGLAGVRRRRTVSSTSRQSRLLDAAWPLCKC